MIELYGMSSPNVFKVSIMLEECGLDWRFTHVDIVKGDQFKAEFLKIGPNNKVPVIVDPDGPDGGPFAVFESGAILLYLGEKTGRMLSSKAARRSVEIQWLMFQMASVGPMFGQLNHFIRYQPPHSEYSLERYRSEVLRIFGVIEARLAEAAYLGGDDISLADAATLPWMRVPLALVPGFKGKPLDEAYAAYPNLVRWMTELLARPGFQRGIARLDERVRELDQASIQSATTDEIDRLLGRGKYARA